MQLVNKFYFWLVDPQRFLVFLNLGLTSRTRTKYQFPPLGAFSIIMSSVSMASARPAIAIHNFSSLDKSNQHHVRPYIGLTVEVLNSVRCSHCPAPHPSHNSLSFILYSLHFNADVQFNITSIDKQSWQINITLMGLPMKLWYYYTMVVPLGLK